MLKVTGFPEPPPVAVALYSTSLRGTEVKVIDWAILVPFTTVCWAWAAGWYIALPAWSASTTQRPSWPKLTAEPEMEHAELVEDESMVKVTGFPEAPPVAFTT